MKTKLALAVFATSLLVTTSVSNALAETPPLPIKIAITPEIKKAFEGLDAIEIREVSGTASKFQVGGTYRVVGVCRQKTFKSAMLYIGNTAEPGSAAIAALDGSSLSKTCGPGMTEFDVTFTLLRPGLLHATVYDMNRVSDNAYAGVYLGDVVFKR